MRLQLSLVLLLLATSPALAQKNNDSLQQVLKARLEMAKRPDSMGQKYVGQQYPDFDFITSTGQRISSASCKGKIVFINLWFESCAPCRAEFPALNALYQAFRNDTAFIMIGLARETSEKLTGLLDKYKLLYPNSAQPTEAYKYNLHHGFPTNIIIGPDGHIVHFSAGGPTSEERATENVMGKLAPVIRAELAKLAKPQN
jgi:peroxiredoxin